MAPSTADKLKAPGVVETEELLAAVARVGIALRGAPGQAALHHIGPGDETAALALAQEGHHAIGLNGAAGR